MTIERKPNRFQPGHIGRPAGTRNRLTGDLLKALANDFAAHGEGVVKVVRCEEPATYLKIIASLVPKKLQRHVLHALQERLGGYWYLLPQQEQTPSTRH
jgi:hypothetical protein